MTPDRRPIKRESRGSSSWQAYQRSLQKRSLQRKTLRTVARVVLVLVLLAGAAYGLVGALGHRSAGTAITPLPAPSGEKSAAGAGGRMHPALLFSKAQVRALVDPHAFLNRRQSQFDIISQGRTYHLKTTLDPALQTLLLDRLDRKHARYIGIVAMNPFTGQVRAMVSYDEKDAQHNTCIGATFPSASIFKIITAAAAIEKLGLNAYSRLKYNGRKHTLYKFQLKDRNNRYTRHISLKDSFAQSINPVFGKLGARALKGTILENYARAFGFNQAIAFELPLLPGVIVVADKPYQWAEVASGFNRTTRITPLHGALIAAAVVNGGTLLEPTIIDSIQNADGETVYRGRLSPVRKAILPQTAREIRRLMATTVRSGTARKVFRGYRRDRVLSRLDLGGKTGSINNDPRYDWFVGFAREKGGAVGLVVAALVAHEKLIGRRAGQYVRMAVTAYFRDYFARKPQPGKTKRG